MDQNAADKDRAERAEALIARMKKARGYIYPEWEFAARQDPDFVDAYNRIYELGLGEGRHVSAKVREFIAIALCVSSSRSRCWRSAAPRRPRSWRTWSARYASARHAKNCSKCSRRAWFRAAPRRFTAG